MYLYKAYPKYRGGTWLGETLLGPVATQPGGNEPSEAGDKIKGKLRVIKDLAAFVSPKGHKVELKYNASQSTIYAEIARIGVNN